MLRCTNARYCKNILGINAITRRKYSTWLIVQNRTEFYLDLSIYSSSSVLNTDLRPYLVVSEIIAIAEPWVSGSART